MSLADNCFTHWSNLSLPDSHRISSYYLNGLYRENTMWSFSMKCISYNHSELFWDFLIDVNFFSSKQLTKSTCAPKQYQMHKRANSNRSCNKTFQVTSDDASISAFSSLQEFMEIRIIHIWIGKHPYVDDILTNWNPGITYQKESMWKKKGFGIRLPTINRIAQWKPFTLHTNNCLLMNQVLQASIDTKSWTRCPNVVLNNWFCKRSNLLINFIL